MEKIKLRTPGGKDFFTQEAYKTLRTNLQFCGRDIRVVVFTSVDENEGKSTVTLNTAHSFAELGKNVLVIDADMRKSVMAGRNSSVKNPQGLSEVLTGMCTIADAIYQVEELPLCIMFAGKYPPNPVELLNGKYFEELLSRCKDQFDYIFIDTPPLGSVIDAAVISANCDGAVLVLGNGRTSGSRAQEVVAQIEKSGCKMLGAVRNFTKKSESSYYYKKNP